MGINISGVLADNAPLSVFVERFFFYRILSARLEVDVGKNKRGKRRVEYLVRESRLHSGVGLLVLVGVHVA